MHMISQIKGVFSKIYFNRFPKGGTSRRPLVFRSDSWGTFNSVGAYHGITRIAHTSSWDKWVVTHHDNTIEEKILWSMIWRARASQAAGVAESSCRGRHTVVTKVNWGAVLVRWGAIGSNLSRQQCSSNISRLILQTQDATRKCDIDREKTPNMKAAVWKFGEQWCSGRCSIVVHMASDRDALYGEMWAAACADWTFKAAGLVHLLGASGCYGIRLGSQRLPPLWLLFTS